MSARDFELQLTAEWAAKVDDISEAVAGIGLLLLSGIVMKSPVNTGRFRGNWIVSTGAIIETTTDTEDADGSSTIAKGAAVLDGYSNKLPAIYIQNNLPYANTLENGRVVAINDRTGFPQWFGSIQAPAGMVALTIAEVEAQMDGKEV